MKEHLVKYAEYNLWANRLLAAVVSGLSENAADALITSSFPTVKKTVLHVLSAEHIWLSRLSDPANVQWLGDSADGPISDVCAKWIAASEKLVEYVSGLSEADLQEWMTYNDLRANMRGEPCHLILLHVFNHSTSHRGQLITMLRQLGITTIPQTDFIAYARLNP
jgi:uncharacterized damage-inducible protein DinB